MIATKSWVSKQPGRCGGNACVRDTRITIWGLEISRRLGMTDIGILEAIVGLTQADLEVAWEYVAAHQDEINRAIRENEDYSDERVA